MEPEVIPGITHPKWSGHFAVIPHWVCIVSHLLWKVRIVV